MATHHQLMPTAGQAPPLDQEPAPASGDRPPGPSHGELPRGDQADELSPEVAQDSHTAVGSAAMPLGALVLVTLVLIPLGLIGGWLGLGIALALLVVGLLALAAYVARLTWTGGGGRRR